MTDGSVRFIDQNVSDEVFQAMATIGGKTPPGFDLDKKDGPTPLVPMPEPPKVVVKPVEKKPVDKQPGGGPADAFKASMQGDWVVKSMQSEGKALPAEALKAFQFSIQGDKITVRMPGKVEESTFTLDVSKSPVRITLTDPGEAKSAPGIIELVKDELRICIRDSKGAPGYPTAFAAPEKSEQMMVVLIRKK